LAGKADEVAKSPFLGRFADKGIEVVLMTDPVDEHTIERMTKYEDFKFENIAKDGIKLDDDDDKEIKEYEEKYKTAKTWLDKALKDSIEKVVFVPGPVTVPGSFKSSQFGWTGNMERLIMAQSSVQEDPMLSFFSKQKKILELNPKNPLVHEILERANSGKATKELKTILRTFTDSMMIWSGYSIRDPAVFAKGIDRLMNQALGLTVEPIASEPEEKEESDAEEDLSLSSMDLDKDEPKKSEVEKDEPKKSEVEKDEPKKSEVEKDREQDKEEL
jgi:heat shock protein beta